MNTCCYVCRNPVPNKSDKAKAGGWCTVMIGSIPIAAMCGDCTSKVDHNQQTSRHQSGTGDAYFDVDTGQGQIAI